MGEKENKPFQLSFNGLLKVDFQGSRGTSDGGLLLVRERDERLGLSKLIDEHLTDSRQGSNKKFPLVDLVRQSVYSRLAGFASVCYEDGRQIAQTRRVLLVALGLGHLNRTLFGDMLSRIWALPLPSG